MLNVIASGLAFSFTGDSQSFTVPSGYDVMTVTVSGGNGGVSSCYWINGYTGGLGGSITSSFSVIPGQKYYVCVGGAGGMPEAGYYDGGNGGRFPDVNAFGGGGGGSSSGILERNCTLLVKAGGGGGAGCYYSGGPGGYLSDPSSDGNSAQSADYDYQGGGGGGYVGGYASSGGASGGTSFTLGSVISYGVGVNAGDGLVSISFSKSGNPLPAPVSPGRTVCVCAPSTPRPTSQPTCNITIPLIIRMCKFRDLYLFVS